MPRNKINLSPPPSYIEEFGSEWRTWFNLLYNRLVRQSVLIPGYTISTVPSAALNSDNINFSSLIYVSDEVGGATLAFSDGTNWRRIQDRIIIS